MSRTDLLSWATAHASGPMQSGVAVAVLALFDECDAAKRVADGLADRVAAQSEILSKRAEK